LAAYRLGLFPMPGSGRRSSAIEWWCPDPRGVLPIPSLRVSRSLRQAVRRYRVTVDTDFGAVIETCARVPRHGGWISDRMADAYITLHRLGWAHSVEVWQDGTLVGGLYGVAIGGLFAGESMFHLRRDASKVALVHLVRELGRDGLLDVQWATPHLVSLGAVEVPRQAYLRRLEPALTRPVPAVFDPGATG
jgi:leucyl/phenylalanyl-tRNA--protein transferase